MNPAAGFWAIFGSRGAHGGPREPWDGLRLWEPWDGQTIGGDKISLCYPIVLPDQKSTFWAGFWPDCYRESIEIGPPAGRRPAGGPISVRSR